MTRRSIVPLFALSVTSLLAGRAEAHVSLEVPKARYWLANMMQADQNKQKTGPCGASRDSRTTDAALITTFKPGEKVTVKWSETIQHPGHFEISFDSDGQDFPTPGTAPAADSGVTVLAANIADKSSKAYSYEVTLPNMECSKCTLQLVQVMTTAAPPYGMNDLYFNCADIVIKADGAGGTGTGGAGTAGSGGVGGSAGGVPGTTGGAGGASTNGGTAGGLGATGGSSGTSTSSGGASGQGSGFGGMPSAGSGGTGTTTSGGASGSGGAPTTSGGALASSGGATGSSGGSPASSGGATITSGGAPTGMSGSTSQPPGGGTPDEPAGCALTAPHRSPSASWLAVAALGLGFLARRRRFRKR